MIKQSIYQKGIIVTNIYIPNISVLKYMTQPLTELQGNTERSKIIGRRGKMAAEYEDPRLSESYECN